MVLRKDPPPGIQVPSRARNGSDPRSSGSRSSTSPRSATHQSSRKDSWELDTDSVYSPDLRTSPAFALMPLEEAQKSPVASSSPWEDELVERPVGMGHIPGTSQQLPGGANNVAYQHTGSSIQSGDDGYQRQHSAGESLGTSPQRFRSNNPFLRARNSSPNPWEDSSQRERLPSHSEQSSSVPNMRPDHSERDSQSRFSCNCSCLQFYAYSPKLQGLYL